MAVETKTEEVIDLNRPVRPTTIPMPTNRTVPSLIPIPNQVAVTVCWVAAGFALGYYLCHRMNSPRSRRNIGD